MAFTSNIRLLSPIFKSLIVSGPRACMRPVAATTYNCARFSSITQQQCHIQQIRSLGSDANAFSRASSTHANDKPISLANILEREIQEEQAEVNQRLSSDQFPGFSVETNHADVKLTKQVGDSTVVIRFTVSSSLSEWRSENPAQQQQQQQQQKQDQDQDQDQEDVDDFSLLSLPEFQVQICRDGQTLEISCYFEELEHDEETGDAFPLDPVFNIDELVMYEGEPGETEFAVNAEYFRPELQDGVLQYLADHGIDDEFAKNLVSFATNYEKKQYIGLMKRMKNFVSK